MYFPEEVTKSVASDLAAAQEIARSNIKQLTADIADTQEKITTRLGGVMDALEWENTTVSFAWGSIMKIRL